MKTLAAVPAFLTLVLVAIYLPTSTEAVCDATATPTEGDLTTMSITEIACDASLSSTFSTLCAHLKRTGLDTALSRSSTTDFFVFAPTNAAFTNARATTGITTPEITKTLQYHVSNDSTDVTCGTARTSILTINGNTKSSTTRCDSSGTLQGQTGNVRTPLPSSPLPNFVATTTGGDATTAITACNGLIRALDQVLGFGPAVYEFGTNAPCSFFSKSCKGAKGAKGRYPTIALSDQTVGGLTFDNIGYKYPKGYKKSKKDKAWSGFQTQTQQQQQQLPGASGAANQNAPFTHPGLSFLYNKYFATTITATKSGKVGKTDKAGKYGKRHRHLRGEGLLQQSEGYAEYESPYEPEEVDY
eukprot:jgi/Psemu1/41779/gm1.41779_g